MKFSVIKLESRPDGKAGRDANELRVAERTDDTDIFVEINVSANRIVTLSRRIIALFGYSNGSLAFSVQRPNES